MKISVIDAGEMGTAMAVLLANAGHDVTLMIQSFDYPHKEMLCYLKRLGTNRRGRRENDLHLPGIYLPLNLKFSDSFDCVDESEFVFLAVPSQYLLASYIRILEKLAKNKKCTLVLLSKGLDEQSNRPWGMRIQSDLRISNNFIMLAGYTPAHCIADSHLTLFSYAASVASVNLNAIKKIRKLFLGTRLGLVGTSDVVGVSWGGLLKNTYAIGYGVINGSIESALTQKYLNNAHFEMKVFLDYFGASTKTWSSPAVKGDFYLTSQGQIDWKSRNVAFGEFLSKFPKDMEINAYTQKYTVEGYEALLVLWAISQHRSLHAPILCAIHSIICFGASPGIVADLMKRN
jgi:glycerol-3-phosphate dehydrogenase (NAD(P)+)